MGRRQGENPGSQGPWCLCPGRPEGVWLLVPLVLEMLGVPPELRQSGGTGEPAGALEEGGGAKGAQWTSFFCFVVVNRLSRYLKGQAL